MADEQDSPLGCLQESLSPQAVALIVSNLHSVNAPQNPRVTQEVIWFREELVRLLGGPQACNDLYKELGL